MRNTQIYKPYRTIKDSSNKTFLANPYPLKKMSVAAAAYVPPLSYILWYDSSNPNGQQIDIITGGLQKIIDLTTNQNDAEQSVPIYEGTYTGTIPTGYVFNSPPTPSYYTTPYTSNPAAETVFIVLSFNAYPPTNSYGLIFGDDTSSYESRTININSNSNVFNFCVFSNQVAGYSGNTKISLNTTYLFTQVYDGNNLSLYVNNLSDAITTSGVTFGGGSPNSVVNGPSFNAYYTLNEMRILPGAATTSQLNLVSTELMTKWNII